MATTVIRYVDPNSSGGDGTTNALTGATAAYASLFAWEAARQRNLVTADEIERVICSSDDAGSTHAADTTAVTIDGWTTDATRYIQIEAASSHGGKWNDNIYRLSYDTSVGTENAIWVVEEYVNLVGLQISRSASNDVGVSAISYTAVGGGNNISKCIIKRGSYNNLRRGINCGGFSGVVNIYNSVVYGISYSGSACIEITGGGTPVTKVYSSTLIGGVNGLKALGTVTAKNIYASGSTAAYTGTISMSTCASSDATGSVGLQNIAVNTTNFTNITAGSEDFHLPSGSALINVGTDTSGDAAPLNFTDDIDGQTRTGTWDIGADEYVAAGGGAVPIAAIINHYKQLGVM